MLEPYHLFEIGRRDDGRVDRRLRRFDGSFAASEKHQERLVGLLARTAIVLATKSVMDMKQAAVGRHHGALILIEMGAGKVLVHHGAVIIAETHGTDIDLELIHVVDIGHAFRLRVREIDWV